MAGSAFADVESYDDWEVRVNDPLAELIRSGALVPIGIQQDGAFAVQIIVSPDAPSSRHQQYHFMTSEPYLVESMALVYDDTGERVRAHAGAVTA